MFNKIGLFFHLLIQALCYFRAKGTRWGKVQNVVGEVQESSMKHRGANPIQILVCICLQFILKGKSDCY